MFCKQSPVSKRGFFGNFREPNRRYTASLEAYRRLIIGSLFFGLVPCKLTEMKLQMSHRIGAEVSPEQIF